MPFAPDYAPLFEVGATAETVLAIFTEVLGPGLLGAPVRLDDNFFDLGGDSALAMAIMLEIERRFGVSLPVSLLFDGATPAAVAMALDGKRAAADGACVLLKPASPDAPAQFPGLFIIPGVHGIARPLSTIARLIDTPGAVHGLQAPGVDGAQTPLAQVEALARAYLATIRRVQPHGRFGLIGYSIGGLVALELACMMAEAGEAPPLLAVVDTLIPRACWPRRARLRVGWRRLRHHAGVLRSQKLTLAVIPYILGRIEAMRWDSRAAPSDISASLDEPLRSVYRANRRAASQYRPRRYPGPICFIEAAPGWWPTYPDILWRPLARNLTIRRAGADHLALIRLGAPDVGAALSDFFRTMLAGPLYTRGR